MANNLVLVDVGNTTMKVGLVCGTVREVYTLPTNSGQTADTLGLTLLTLMQHAGCTRKDFAACVVCSVVPAVDSLLRAAIARYVGCPILFTPADLPVPLENRYLRPEQVGADRLVAAHAARVLNPHVPALIVVDFGTALTFSTVDRKGNVLGVAITPGLVTAVNSLFGATAQLPQVELKIPSSALGRDSQDSIRSGIMLGYAGLVDKMVEKTEKEIGEDLYVVATGGLSSTIFPLLTKVNEIDPMHTLKGLLLIGSLN